MKGQEKEYNTSKYLIKMINVLIDKEMFSQNC